MATPARISAVCVCAAAVAGVWALWSHRRLKLLQAKLQNIFEAAEKVQKAQEAPAPVQV